MLLPGPDLYLVGPLTLWYFCDIFLPNTGEDQTKVLPERGALALSHKLNPSMVIALPS